MELEFYVSKSKFNWWPSGRASACQVNFGTQTIDSVTLVGVLFPSVYMARVLFPSGTNDRVFLCLSVLILVILNC